MQGFVRSILFRLESVQLVLGVGELFLQFNDLLLGLLHGLHGIDGILQLTQHLGIAALMHEEGKRHQQKRGNEEDHDIDNHRLFIPGFGRIGRLSG